jgi:hypothetical protein
VYLRYLASQISVTQPKHRSGDLGTYVSVYYISVSRATVYLCICVVEKSTPVTDLYSSCYFEETVLLISMYVSHALPSPPP